MDANIKRVLTAIYELEGLLNVVKNRDVSSRGLIDELIRDKAAQISAIVNEIYTGTSDDETTPDLEHGTTRNLELGTVQETEEEFEQEAADEVREEVPEEVSEEYSVEESDEELMAESAEFEVEEDADEPENEEAQVEEHDEIGTDNIEIEDNVADIEDEEPVIDDEVFEDEDSENEDSDTFYEDEDIDSGFDDEDLNRSYEDDDEDELRVDEQLSRTLSKNLKKAFTLNDRFRFRRELFGNHDVEFNDTLNLVEAMHSFDEAEDYFYNDLQWDKDSPEVIDFMKIIEKHFA